MDIPGRRTKTGPSKLIMELVLFLCLVHDDANSVMLDHLREYAPISPRTAYRYIHDLEAVQKKHTIRYRKDPMRESIIATETEDQPSIPEPKLRSRTKVSVTDIRLHELIHSLPRAYLDLGEPLEDPHLVHLHRLINIDERFSGISKYYDQIKYDLDDFLLDAVEARDRMSSSLGISPDEPLSHQIQPDPSLKSTKLKKYYLDKQIEKINYYTNRDENELDPFPVTAPEIRDFLLQDYDLKSEGLSLRTVQRYLKELKTAYMIYARIYRKSTYF